jgi:prephenate dehydrogenase
MTEDGFALPDATVAIVGLGLMGGSLALALRAKNICQRILGITRNPAARESGLARGAIDAASADLSLASEADVIILATPVRTILDQIPQVGQIAREGAVVMDLGSTKRAITQAMEALPPHVEPIGAHPMCGKETFGFDAAEADLYRNATFVLTPLARTSASTLALAESLVRAIGARPLVLDAARHDQMVALTSHLPFALASTLMTTVGEMAHADASVYRLAASGFRDTTRLAAGDATMMLDTLITNRENVSRAVRLCAHHLNELADLIAAGNEPELRSLLQSAAVQRRALKFDI